MGDLRENSSSAVNFFFLVDIFTCTLGIMILVALLLTMRPQPQGDTIVLRPGEDPPEVRISKLSHALSDLTEFNVALKAKVAWAKGLPNLAALTNRYQQLKLTSVTLSVQTNMLGREVEMTTRVVDKLLASMGLTNAAVRIASLERQLTNTAVRIRNYEQTNGQLRSQIEQTRRHPRIVRISKTAKPPILVTVSRGRVAVELLDTPNTQTVLTSPVSDDGFVDAVGRFKQSSNYVVFFVRPSGIALYTHLYHTAKLAGFEIGSDAMDENGSLSFSRND